MLERSNLVLIDTRFTVSIPSNRKGNVENAISDICVIHARVDVAED